MTMTDRLTTLGLAAENELMEEILPFWASRVVDHEQGGFFGRIGEDGRPDPSAGKGGVLNARILWTFSAALRLRPDPAYRAMADRAFDYLLEHFWDADYSGLYWEVDSRGGMLQGRKQTYGQAFGVYALAEYFRATGVPEALARADRLFEDIETHAFDPANGGYWEARGRDWQPIDDIRLSAIDLNAPFSMNTHLHLLEAYTGLVRASDTPRHRDRLRAVLEIVLGRIIDSDTGHLILFQDEQWRPMSGAVSYGHEIETSWLLCEAAETLASDTLATGGAADEGAALLARTHAAAMRLADGVLEHGYDKADGGVYYEKSAAGHLDTNKEWWGQAEGVIGFLNAYQLSGRSAYLDAALCTWDFIDAHVIDRVVGEWRTLVTCQGEPVPGFARVDFWKCPYHNARAMLEIVERVRAIGAMGSR
jgi:cellobiose epimerase